MGTFLFRKLAIHKRTVVLLGRRGYFRVLAFVVALAVFLELEGAITFIKRAFERSSVFLKMLAIGTEVSAG